QDDLASSYTEIMVKLNRTRKLIESTQLKIQQKSQSITELNNTIKRMY
ncbi:621_t:CDS:1, partial [Funneliformis geosporum]